MPNRIIKDSIKTSHKIDSLSWFEEVVFYRLLITADDYGCLDGRTVILKNSLFPTKETVTKKAIEDAISKLVSVGLLCKYTVSGMPYLFFPAWEKHQRLRNKNRKFPWPQDADTTCQSIDGQLTVNCQSNDSELSEQKEIEVEQEVEQEKNIYCPAKPDRVQIIKAVIDHLNSVAGKNYKSTSDDTRKHINARLSDGFTEQDLIDVIDKKAYEWIGTDMEQYLRPQTLFCSKFESYLNAPWPRRKANEGHARNLDVIANWVPRGGEIHECN